MVTVGVSYELLVAALKASHNPLVWVDKDGIVLVVNEHAREIFGRIHTGTHISQCAAKYELLRPDGSPYPPLEIPLARAALRGEHVREERCKIRRPNGRIVDVYATAYPLRDDAGAQIGAILTMRDVTEELALETKLRIAEQRFNALVIATGQLVWTTDARGLVVEDSPSWRAFTGQTRGQFVGEGWVYFVHPEDREQAANAWRAAVETRRPYEVEYRLRRKDGEYRWTMSRGAPTFDDAGNVREWIGCTWDIQDTKRH